LHNTSLLPVTDHQRQCGWRLRRLIAALELRQTQAAAEMGVTKMALNNWLRGDSYPAAYALYRFARLRHLNLYDYVFLGDWSVLPARVAETLRADALSKLEAEKAPADRVA
jgi:transcriptional regulator with XRE-family HTH domain